jgi:hypothetical protein
MTVGGRMRVLLVMLVVLCVAPAGADAGQIARLETSLVAASGKDTFAPGTLAAGPVLAGDRVVWAQVGADQAFTIRSATVAGVRPQTVATLPLPAQRGFDGDSHQLALFGAPDRLAWFEGVESYDDAKYQQSTAVVKRFVAGPPGGPFATVAGCDAPGSCRAPACYGSGGYGDRPWAALTGGALLVATWCKPDDQLDLVDDPRPRTLWHVDPGGGVAAPLAQVDAEPLAAAGGLVAVRASDGTVTLRSTADGHVGATLPSLDAPQSGRGASLQTDGTLAVRRYLPGAGRPAPVDLRVPGDPRVHALDVHAIDDHVELADDRLLLVRALHDGARELGVARLDGAGPFEPLLHLVPSRDREHRGAELRGFAREGDHVAWIVSLCEQLLVGRATLEDAPVSYSPQVCAAPRIVTGGPLRVHRDGRLRVAITCGRACAGTVRLWRSTGPQPVLGRFHLAGSTEARHVLVRVPDSVRRQVARAGRSGIGLRLSTDPSWRVTTLALR